MKRTAGILFCILVSAAGLITDAAAFHPGLLSPDSLDQYSQALSNKYSDWHPPIMSALWYILNHIHSGPHPVFYFQLFLLWLSCLLLMLLFLKRYSYLVLLVPALLVMPFVQNFIANIWKDVHLALAWLLASSVMLRAVLENRKMKDWESGLSLLLISYGCWVRSNAPPGVFPLAALWLVALSGISPGNLRSWSVLSIKAAAITVGILICQTILERGVLKADREYIQYRLFLHDMSGIYVKTGELYFPTEVTTYTGFDTAYIRKNYRYATLDNIWWNAEKKKIFPSEDENTVKAMRRCWVKGIIAHPLVYLKNRTRGYLNFLKLRPSGNGLEILYPYTHPNGYGFTYEPNSLASWIFTNINLCRGRFFLQPYFWFFLNFLILALVFSRILTKIRIPVIAIAGSSLFYILFEFIVFPADTEFRYFYWNCLSLGLCAILILAECVKYYSTPKSIKTGT